MKYYLLTILIIIGTIPRLHGQMQVYYYGSNTRLVENLDNSHSYKEVNQKSENKYVIKSFNKVGSQWERTVKERIKVQKNGDQLIRYNANTFFSRKMVRSIAKIGPDQYQFEENRGEITRRTGVSSNFLPLHLEGIVTEFHPNSQVKSISEYNDNQLISNENWQSDGSKYIDSIFYSTDKGPEYKNGDAIFKRFLLQKLADSKIDLTMIEDEIVIGWVVMETGDIDGVIALQGKSGELNRILVGIISEMPGKWEPAILDGSIVRYFMTIPLNFKQNNTRFQDIELSSGMLHYTSY